jgi:hypothetical protein
VNASQDDQRRQAIKKPKAREDGLARAPLLELAAGKRLHGDEDVWNLGTPQSIEVAAVNSFFQEVEGAPALQWLANLRAIQDDQHVSVKFTLAAEQSVLMIHIVYAIPGRQQAFVLDLRLKRLHGNLIMHLLTPVDEIPEGEFPLSQHMCDSPAIISYWYMGVLATLRRMNDNLHNTLITYPTDNRLR